MLEVFYEERFSKIPIFDRKISLNVSPTILYGPPRSGKTFLVFALLSTLPPESYLYIDCHDLRIDLYRLHQELIPFVKSHPISLVVLDNYEHTLPLPPVTTILVTRTPFSLSGFTTQRLLPLDFEEYLSFWYKLSPDRKAPTVANLFTHFLKEGSLPEIVTQHDPLKTQRFQEILTLLAPHGAARALLFFLFRHMGFKLSAHQIYSQIKQIAPLSKDKTYALLRQFEESLIVVSISRYGANKGTKKYYPYDFGLAMGLSLSKEIFRSFETMIAWHLLRRNLPLYYTEGIDFFIPSLNMAILAIPFATDEIVRGRISKLYIELRSLAISHVTLVTMGLTSELNFEAIRCQAIPFWDWATQETEGGM